jgi:hypothetical protein
MLAKGYEYNKTWRHRHPSIRNRGKTSYYRRLAKNRINKGKRWSKKHKRLVIAHEYTDRLLAQMLGRSVQAIQILRTKLKKVSKSLPDWR